MCSSLVLYDWASTARQECGDNLVCHIAYHQNSMVQLFTFLIVIITLFYQLDKLFTKKSNKQVGIAVKSRT